MSKVMAGRFHGVLLGAFELYDAVGWPPPALYRMFQFNEYDRSRNKYWWFVPPRRIIKACGFFFKSPYLKGESFGVHNRFTDSRLRGCYIVWTGTGLPAFRRLLAPSSSLPDSRRSPSTWTA